MTTFEFIAEIGGSINALNEKEALYAIIKQHPTYCKVQILKKVRKHD